MQPELQGSLALEPTSHGWNNDRSQERYKDRSRDVRITDDNSETAIFFPEPAPG